MQKFERQAQAAIGERDFVSAIAKYEWALAASPRNPDAEIGLAQAYRGVHNYDETKEVLGARSAGASAVLATLGNLEIEPQTYEPAPRHFGGCSGP